jgi:hypothetical protein
LKGLERRLAKAKVEKRAHNKRWNRRPLTNFIGPGTYVTVELVQIRELEHEERVRAGIPSELPPYTEEETQFLADCTARDLQRAQEIIDRYHRANGRIPFSDMTPNERERELERQCQESERPVESCRRR